MRALVLAFALLAFPALAEAQVLYGATGGNAPSNLYSINTTTGAATVIGPTGQGLTGLALHPTTNVMYGVTTTFAGCARCLVTINLATGASTPIGPLGFTIAEIAFRADGTLYGWSETNDVMAIINIATGAAVEIGPGTNSAGDGLVFSGGLLYLMPSGDSGSYYTVDPTTGVVTLVGTLSGSAVGGAVSAATTQPGTGTVFIAINGGGGQVGRVDLATGVITLIGAAVNGIDALEFGPATSAAAPANVPTLSQWTLLLLMLSLALLGSRSLRRK
jgi:hypothetical protein